MSEVETFDVRNFAQTMREIHFFRVRQLNRPDDSGTFFQAQTEMVALRSKLTTAYNLAVKRSKRKKTTPPELWMFGLCAYKLIVVDRENPIDVFLKRRDLADKATEFGFQLEDESEIDEDAFFFQKLMPGDE